MVVLCAVFEWCDIDVKLIKAPKVGVFISLKFLFWGRQCSGILAPVLRCSQHCSPEVIQCVYSGRLIFLVPKAIGRVRDLVETCLS